MPGLSRMQFQREEQESQLTGIYLLRQAERKEGKEKQDKRRKKENNKKRFPIFVNRKKRGFVDIPQGKRRADFDSLQGKYSVTIL